MIARRIQPTKQIIMVTIIIVVAAAVVVVVVVVVVALRLTRSCREQNWENATS